jgi:hypothetical protein
LADEANKSLERITTKAKFFPPKIRDWKIIKKWFFFIHSTWKHFDFIRLAPLWHPSKLPTHQNLTHLFCKFYQRLRTQINKIPPEMKRKRKKLKF